MKAATVKELKTALTESSHQELLEICVRLSKFKKENKALLTYLLFESSDEEQYIESVQDEIRLQFEQMNTKTYYFMKKSIRKILRMTKTYIRYSQHKETEVELLLFFCKQLKDVRPPITHNTVLKNLHIREVNAIRKKIAVLHEDLQYDYGIELEEVAL